MVAHFEAMPGQGGKPSMPSIVEEFMIQYACFENTMIFDELTIFSF